MSNRPHHATTVTAPELQGATQGSPSTPSHPATDPGAAPVIPLNGRQHIAPKGGKPCHTNSASSPDAIVSADTERARDPGSQEALAFDVSSLNSAGETTAPATFSRGRSSAKGEDHASSPERSFSTSRRKAKVAAKAKSTSANHTTDDCDPRSSGHRSGSPIKSGTKVQTKATGRRDSSLRPTAALNTVYMSDLKVDGCRWPVGMKGHSYTFCNAPQATGKPYCKDHASIAYREPRQDDHDEYDR